MKQSGKIFITLILTYGFRKLGYWFINYEPFLFHPQYVGIAIDITIWISLFYLIAWVLDKVIQTKES